MYGNIDILTYSIGFKFKDNIPTLPNFGGFNFKMAMTLHCRRHHLDSFLKVLQESKCFANSLKKIIITKHKITTCSKAIFYYIYIYPLAWQLFLLTLADQPKTFLQPCKGKHKI